MHVWCTADSTGVSGTSAQVSRGQWSLSAAKEPGKYPLQAYLDELSTAVQSSCNGIGPLRPMLMKCWSICVELGGLCLNDLLPCNGLQASFGFRGFLLGLLQRGAGNFQDKAGPHVDVHG